MNKSLVLAVALSITTAPTLSAASNALTADPAYLPIDKVLDLKKVQPQVNVNLPRFLLKNVASEFHGGPGDPFASVGLNFADLIKDIKLIRVLVIEATPETAKTLNAATQQLRHQLESNWMPIVSVPEDNVGVYALSDKAGEEMAGLALLIDDGGDVIFANIVGNVPIGKILKTVASLNSGNLPDFQQIISQLTQGAQGTSSLAVAPEPPPAQN